MYMHNFPDAEAVLRSEACLSQLFSVPFRQWPEVSDFLARFCTKRVQFSHVSVFSDSRNMQKSVTQIIYLGPLPTIPHRLWWHKWYAFYYSAICTDSTVVKGISFMKLDHTMPCFNLAYVQTVKLCSHLSTLLLISNSLNSEHSD